MEKEKFFSIKGRLRRSEYLRRSIPLAIPAAILNIMAEDSSDIGLLLLSIIVLFISGILIAIQAVKRLHDINLSAWFWFVFIIPFVNIVLAIYMLFKDGVHGPNKYGEDPKGRQIVV